MELNSLKDLFIDQLKDVYNAEKQLTKALPKMAKCATNEELKEGFLSHLEETEGQIERLEKIFEELGEKATGKTCAAMKGLVEEGSEVLEADGDSTVIDAALIAAAQRVEHYEMAAYGCLRSYAELLEMPEAARLLQETLDEEVAADLKLSTLADESINSDALMAGEDEESDSESPSKEKKKNAQGNKKPSKKNNSRTLRA